jgi:hypothetical protein
MPTRNATVESRRFYIAREQKECQPAASETFGTSAANVQACMKFPSTAAGPTGPTCPAPSSLPPLFPCCDNFWGSQFLGFLGAEGTEITVRDAPRLPTTKPECKNGGWKTYGVFKNQGDCVSFVATGGKNPAGQ